MREITFILLTLFSLNVFANESLFNTANERYSQEKYSEAILLYDSILTKGLESSELYYNLGNCYYKTNDWANAIWHYEKSLQLTKHEKTDKNLALTRLKIVDRIEPLPQLFYKKWWLSLQSFLNTKHWQYLSILSIFLALVFGILHKLLSKNTKNYFNFSLYIALILFLISLSSYQNTVVKQEGIIFESAVVIKSAPSSNSTELFTLHAGTKLEIIDAIGNWIQVKIANGNNGWLLQNSVKEL